MVHGISRCVARGYDLLKSHTNKVEKKVDYIVRHLIPQTVTNKYSSLMLPLVKPSNCVCLGCIDSYKLPLTSQLNSEFS